jgi:replicative DNA helicase
MSVEAFVLSELVCEGSPKRAFQAGISENDFDMHDEEFKWLVAQYESKKPINARRFKKKFPDFEIVRADEKLTDLIDELKQERAYVAISAAIDDVLDGDEPIDNENALQKAGELREILTDVLRSHSAVSDSMIFGDIGSHLQDMKRLQAMSENGEVPGIPTGLPHIDLHCGGLQREATTLVLGRPGDAKSFLLARFAVEATWNGFRVGVFSPEMTEHQHRCRFGTLLSAKPEVQEAVGLKGAFRNRALKDGRDFNYKKYKRFLEWCKTELKGGEIALFTQKYRREKMTPQYIASRAEDLGLDLVIVDPIYKLKTNRRINDRWDRIAEIVDQLTDMAHTLNIPVVMSNQATRSLVGNRGEGPDKDTSFASDSPVQEADVVMGVKHFSEERVMKVNCSKNRHGEPFKFTISFWPNTGKMDDVTPLKGDYTNGYDPEKAEELRKELRGDEDD